MLTWTAAKASGDLPAPSGTGTENMGKSLEKENWWTWEDLLAPQFLYIPSDFQIRCVGKK